MSLGGLILEVSCSLVYSLGKGRNQCFKGCMFTFMFVRGAFLIGCRPIIGLDGCHLKEAMGGQLLSAIERCGNDDIFSIA